MISDEQLKAARQEQDLPAWTQDAATPAQVGYIKGLIESRDIPESWLLRIKELVEAEGGLKKGDAGKIIGALKDRPVKLGQDDRSKNKPTIMQIPPGRYAIQDGDDDNDISFYRVKELRNKSRIILRIVGPNEYMLKSNAPIKAIVRAGIGNAASLYGLKVGRCSQCNTRITNRLSRELGIGPVCGGRVYGDWQERVNRARNSLVERGLDPQEVVND